MEIKISFDDLIDTYIINEDIKYEEMDGEGYFYIPSTEKIIIMNKSCFYLWNCILECAKKEMPINFASLKKGFEKNFDMTDYDDYKFINDMKKAIFHFINEKFVYLDKVI